MSVKNANLLGDRAYLKKEDFIMKRSSRRQCLTSIYGLIEITIFFPRMLFSLGEQVILENKCDVFPLVIKKVFVMAIAKLRTQDAWNSLSGEF